MEQTMIDKLIETAIEQLKFSYTPYSISKSVQHYLQKTERFILDAILKMRRIHLQTVQKEQRSLKL